MGKIDINDISVTSLARMPVSGGGGDVLHGIRKTDFGFIKFGEAYFSILEPNAIKAWKKHLRMTLNLIVPVGKVRFVFIDDNNFIREEIIGEDRYVRLTVPPGFWFGFQGLDNKDSLILNVADLVHDPDEIEKKEKNEFNFEWRIL